MYNDLEYHWHLSPVALAETDCVPLSLAHSLAEDVGSDALATLIVNRLKHNFKCVAVKAPFFGENRLHVLEDIAV